PVVPLAPVVPPVPGAGGAGTHEPAAPPAAHATVEAGDAQADDALADALREHFRQVTGMPIAARQNFFDAGASSLMLVQLHVRLQQAGHDRLAVTDLFAHPSPLALAARLAGSDAPVRTGAPDAVRLARLDERRARLARRKGTSS
ncbi:acyl carrier protein, partial [Trinickia mobilis]|uniref:acyl carrier protein n=1 Tax=Trinickia mobilis TaxID=2816356 RepID=UPI001A8FA11F